MSDPFEVDPGDAEIVTLVHGEMRRVDMALWCDVQEQLAEKYRAQGLTGQALDEAICAERPSALALALGESGTQH